MKKTFLFVISGVIFILLAIFFQPSFAQDTSGIKIKAIPQPLHWENSPIKYSTTDNGLTIQAGPKTDMFRDPNVSYNTDNAPKLLFKADENFVLTAAIEHSFSSKWDGGAIIIKQDSLNWIKFCFEKDYTGAKRVVSVVTRNLSDDCNSVEVASNKVYYKVARADNVFTLYYSTNGAKWFLVRHFQFEMKGVIQVGFLAQSPEGKMCEVKFSEITYAARKIKDPYTGE